MKKFAIGIGIIVLIALIMPAGAAGNAAFVGNVENCQFYVGPYGDASNLNIPSFSQLVINGNVWKLTCRGYITENFPKEIFTYEGTSGCWLNSNYFKVILTPGGQATMTCIGTINNP